MSEKELKELEEFINENSYNEKLKYLYPREALPR